MGAGPVSGVYSRTLSLPIIAVTAALSLAGCQTNTGETASSPIRDAIAVLYSGWFVWDSERDLGGAAYQCMSLVLESREELDDGRIRFEGRTRYITGAERKVDFVETEMVMNPETSTFVMRESSPTNENFVTDGHFEGRATRNRLFLSGAWIGEDKDTESGTLSLRRGGDAPCAPDEPL